MSSHSPADQSSKCYAHPPPRLPAHASRAPAPSHRQNRYRNCVAAGKSASDLREAVGSHTCQPEIPPPHANSWPDTHRSPAPPPPPPHYRRERSTRASSAPAHKSQSAAPRSRSAPRHSARVPLQSQSHPTPPPRSARSPPKSQSQSANQNSAPPSSHPLAR